MTAREHSGDEGVQNIERIAIRPNVRNGRACIVGTTVTVADVAIAHIYHQQDADGIADWYALSLPGVYAALSYYYDHKAEIDTQIRAQIQIGEDYEAKRIGNAGSFLTRQNF